MIIEMLFPPLFPSAVTIWVEFPFTCSLPQPQGKSLGYQCSTSSIYLEERDTFETSQLCYTEGNQDIMGKKEYIEGILVSCHLWHHEVDKKTEPTEICICITYRIKNKTNDYSRTKKCASFLNLTWLHSDPIKKVAEIFCFPSAATTWDESAFT